jgi:mlo protein
MRKWVVGGLLAATATTVSAGAGNDIEHTMSWKVAIFFILFLIISILFENLLHYVDHKLHHNSEAGLRLAVEKIKDEIMLMGFISLVLLSVESSIVGFCVPDSLYHAYGIPYYHCNADYYKSKGYGNTTNATAVRRLLEMGSGGGGGVDNTNTAAPPPGPTSLLGAIPFLGAPRRGVSETARRLAAAADGERCASQPGTIPLIDTLALHNAHQLIFMMAVIHITYACGIMFISQIAQKRLNRWERFGDDADEDASALKAPKRVGNTAVLFFLSLFEQFWTSIDAFTFLALRRFYIAKHNLKHDFDFSSHVNKALVHDFHEVLGIRAWMWMLLIVQVLFEGYGWGQHGAFGFAALALSMTIGAKLKMTMHMLSLDIFTHYDKDGDGSISAKELSKLQYDDTDKLAGIEPHFWLNRPGILLTGIQCTMWLNSSQLAMAFFYATVIDDACYIKLRGNLMYLQIAMAFGMFCINALFNIPTYSFVTHMGSHQKAQNLAAITVLNENFSHLHPELSDGIMNGLHLARFSNNFSRSFRETREELRKQRALELLELHNSLCEGVTAKSKTIRSGSVRRSSLISAAINEPAESEKPQKPWNHTSTGTSTGDAESSTKRDETGAADATAADKGAVTGGAGGNATIEVDENGEIVPPRSPTQEASHQFGFDLSGEDSPEAHRARRAQIRLAKLKGAARVKIQLERLRREMMAEGLVRSDGQLLVSLPMVTGTSSSGGGSDGAGSTPVLPGPGSVAGPVSVKKALSPKKNKVMPFAPQEEAKEGKEEDGASETG